MHTDLKDIKEENHPVIYFQDDLTAKREKLLYEATQIERQNLIIDTWVCNSKVYIKDRLSRIRVIKMILISTANKSCKPNNRQRTI